MMEEISDLISDITEAAKSDPGHIVNSKPFLQCRSSTFCLAFCGPLWHCREKVSS
jgi:hypothetical protein